MREEGGEEERKRGVAKVSSVSMQEIDVMR